MAQNYAGAAKARLTGVAVLGILLASSTTLGAQNILPLSPQCEAPASDIATQASLPHLATALQFRKSLRVMAIGSSSTFGLGASLGKSYPAQLAEMLEKSLKGVVTNSGDGLHLNDIGYRCMAEHIGHAVVANVFAGRFAVPEPGDLLASGSTSR